jgi:hypothetical protein
MTGTGESAFGDDSQAPRKKSRLATHGGGNASARPDQLPFGDPYAYYDGTHVPRLKDLVLPSRQRFSHGELRGSTFSDVYISYGFSMYGCGVSEPDSDEDTDLDLWDAGRARLSDAYSGTEIWKRFLHYCRAMSSNELHDYD